MCDEKNLSYVKIKYNVSTNTIKLFFGFQMPRNRIKLGSLELPMVQKPITGRGSRGFELLKNDPVLFHSEFEN